jgi:hypothetical protein
VEYIAVGQEERLIRRLIRNNRGWSRLGLSLIGVGFVLSTGGNAQERFRSGGWYVLSKLIMY